MAVLGCAILRCGICRTKVSLHGQTSSSCHSQCSVGSEAAHSASEPRSSQCIDAVGRGLGSGDGDASGSGASEESGDGEGDTNAAEPSSPQRGMSQSWEEKPHLKSQFWGGGEVLRAYDLTESCMAASLNAPSAPSVGRGPASENGDSRFLTAARSRSSQRTSGSVV